MRKTLILFIAIMSLFVTIGHAELDEDGFYLVPTLFFKDYVGFDAKSLAALSEENLAPLFICVGHYYTESCESFEWDVENEDASGFACYSADLGDNLLWFFMLNKKDMNYWLSYLDFDRGTMWTYPSAGVSEERLINVMFPAYEYIKGTNAELSRKAWAKMEETAEMMID